MTRQPVTIYVCNLMGELMYPLEDIDKESVSLHERLNGQAELTFVYKKSKEVVSPAYDALEEGMYLFVETIGHFKIRQPSVQMDAATESKSITAYSCDVEFEDKTLTFQVNMGVETSLEYLVEYVDGETEVLINPHTGVPYDWIVLYNTYPKQLAAFAEWYEDQEQVNGEVTIRQADDADGFAYLDAMLTQIPRLYHKAIDNDEFVQYVTKILDAHEDTIGYILSSNFGTRITNLIAYYERYRAQLSLLDIVCEKMGGVWIPGKVYGVQNGDYTLANKRFQLDINEGAYSFLGNTLAQKSKCLVGFDKLERTINVTPVEFIGEDTGIELSYSQLLNTLNIATTEDTLATRLTVYGAEGPTGDALSIEQVNFGEDAVIDIDYKLNARDTNGHRIYVSDALAEKYARYKQYRDEVARPAYIAKSREINTLQAEINEMKYRLPRDSVQTDWDAMTDEELDGERIKFSNMLHALYELYAEDYGRAFATPQDPWAKTGAQYIYPTPTWMEGFVDPNEVTLIPRTEFIKQTVYWSDYVAYGETISQINIAMQAREKSEVSFKFANIVDGSGDVTIQKMFNTISAWETEWSLYGTQELQHKVGAYDKQMQAMIDAETIQVKHLAWDDLDASLQSCFNTSGDFNFESACEVLEKKRGYYSLSPEEKAMFVDEESYTLLLEANITLMVPIAYSDLTNAQKQKYGNMAANYLYDNYKQIYDLRQEAQEACDRLQIEIDAKTSEMETAQAARLVIMADAKVETYSQNGESFTPFECKVLNLLYRDADYTNGNILTTSLDDTISAIDKMVELYDDAVEQASIFSRPQLTFTVDVDNIMALPQFAAWDSQFKLGNYIYIEYRDGFVVKARMVGCTYNPVLATGNFSLEFSNVVYSKLKVSDVESVLGMASATSSSRSSSSGGGTGVSREFSDLSNTMLQKLLTPDSFVKEVSAVVADKVVKRANTSNEQVYNSLMEGFAEVSGGCLKTGVIASTEQNSSEDPLTMINLNNGEFSFANGALMFYFGRDENGNIARDENGEPVSYLFVKGQVEADSGNIGGVQIGDPYVDPSSPDAEDLALLYTDRLFIGRNGFFFVDADDDTGYINNNFSAGITAGDNGNVQIHAWRYVDNPSRNMIDDMTAHLFTTLDHNGLHIAGETWNASTRAKTADRYVNIDSATGVVQVMSASSPTVLSTYDRYVQLNSDGTIVTTGAITAGGAITATGKITGGSFGAVDSDGAVSGTTVTAKNSGVFYGGRMELSPANDQYGVKVTGYYNGYSSRNNIRAEQTSVSGVYAELRCNGDIACSGNVSGSSSSFSNADYAEFYEWLDGNPTAEDRRGRFVTMDGDKIRLATAADSYILGIVSSTPSVVGNAAQDCWHDKYMRDEFGAIITEPVRYAAVLDDNGNVVREECVVYEPVLNPAYDETRSYIPREQRQEWSPVGMVGQLIMLDDGTCEINRFATSADDGIATRADGVTGYRVIKRIDDHHIMVAAK